MQSRTFIVDGWADTPTNGAICSRCSHERLQVFARLEMLIDIKEANGMIGDAHR